MFLFYVVVMVESAMFVERSHGLGVEELPSPKQEQQRFQRFWVTEPRPSDWKKRKRNSSTLIVARAKNCSCMLLDVVPIQHSVKLPGLQSLI